MAIKADFQRINNVILMTILEQGNEINRGCGIFFEDFQNNVCLHSISCPEIKNLENNIKLYVQGSNIKSNNKTSCLECETVSIAKDIMKRCTNTIENYNKICNKEIYPEEINTTLEMCN